MEVPHKTYLLIGKTLGITMEFKYDLNGLLLQFKMLEGELNLRQEAWLFSGKFPYREVKMQNLKTEKYFEVQENEPDLSFDTFWDAYNYKLGKKVQVENTWKRLSIADKKAALAGIRSYDNYLARNNGRVAKAYPSSYLTQRYWENDYKSAA